MFATMRAFFDGGCSSVGRVPDCDSGCRGFEPHQSPQIKTLVSLRLQGFFIFGAACRFYAAAHSWHASGEREGNLRGQDAFFSQAVLLWLYSE